MSNHKKASVVLIIKDGLILSISRRNDSSKFGLIGGKVDAGETPAQAAIRETKEEAGLDIHDLTEINIRLEPPDVPGGQEFMAHCFYVTNWSGVPTRSEEGDLKWLTVKEITETSSAFPDYNKDTILKFKKLYPKVYLKED